MEVLHALTAHTAVKLLRGLKRFANDHRVTDHLLDARLGFLVSVLDNGSGHWGLLVLGFRRDLGFVEALRDRRLLDIVTNIDTQCRSRLTRCHVRRLLGQFHMLGHLRQSRSVRGGLRTFQLAEV